MDLSGGRQTCFPWAEYQPVLVIPTENLTSNCQNLSNLTRYNPIPNTTGAIMTTTNNFTWHWANDEDHSSGVVVTPLPGVSTDEIEDAAVSNACGMPVKWFDGCGDGDDLYVPAS